MKNIIKTCSLLSLMAVIPGAMAATSRVSMITKPSTRLPSIAGYIVANTTAKTTTTTTTYLADVDCIDNYTACIKADDACGSDFEECTTNVLFHGQMSKCLSTLYQCSSSGINALFGTSAINALSTVSTYKTVDGVQEVERYTYPTDGSVLGQLIIGADISNKLTTEQCVRRYTNCLKREDICGEDFELCTDQKSFKKQALLCDSTLSRCQNEGKIQMFGSVANASSLKPGSNSRIGTLIEEGAALAALNAVKTCNKVVDNCLVNSCAKNPFRCVEGISLKTIDTTDIIAGVNGDNFQIPVIKGDDGTELTTASDVRKLLKTQCLETIGANKYCHMTYREKMPTKRELGDPELQEEVFSLAYSARKSYANTKIQEEIKKFDSTTKNNCIDTISSCVMRSCGGGIGSVCYKKSRSDSKIGEVNVNSKSTYNDIKAGCSAIVNADANCIYAAMAGGEDGYQYSFVNNDTFTTLFPEHTGSEDDQIGAVATLNSLLATSYNDAAIENMRKQCQTTALGCVKSMCGSDYENCYRNRTDIVAGTYDTGNSRLDRSMNKMGGILDYNIVIGLCMNTVKTSAVCEEHLKVAAADWRDSEYTDNTSWYDGEGNKYASVRGGWLDANTTKVNDVNSGKVLIACAISQEEAAAKADCMFGDQTAPVNEGTCDGVMDEDGCLYTDPVYQSTTEYVLENAGKTLFQTLLSDVEREAQAKYNAKLTKEQNACLAQNNGGIRGALDNGSTFMWVKLKGNKVPKNYNMAGLKTKEFTASNDLYGSFCRARITVASDDKDIQELLGDKATAYFAVGDTFACGSWIDQKTLEKITQKVGEKARKDAGEGTASEKNALAWGTVGPALVGGIASYLISDSLQKKGNSLGGLLSSGNNQKEKQNNLKSCVSNLNQAQNATDLNQKRTYFNNAVAVAKRAGVEISDDMGKAAVSTWKDGEPVPEGKTNISSSNADTYISTLKAQCEAAQTATTEDTSSTKKRRNTNLIAAGVGTVVTGALGFGITKSVLAAKYDGAENDAIAKWMSEVGEHIQCYLGTEELGSYGDIVSFTVE